MTCKGVYGMKLLLPNIGIAIFKLKLSLALLSCAASVWVSCIVALARFVCLLAITINIVSFFFGD